MVSSLCLKLFDHVLVHVAFLVVEVVVSGGVGKVEVVEVCTAAERDIHQLLRVGFGVLVHDGGVRSSLRLVHRYGAGLHEGELSPLASNASLAVDFDWDRARFDWNPCVYGCRTDDADDDQMTNR